MHAELVFVPAAILTAAAVVGETVSEVGAYAAPVGAVGAVIYVIGLFLKRQEAAAKESKETMDGVLAQARENSDRIVSGLSAITVSLGGVREDVAKLVDRNSAKDAA